MTRDFLIVAGVPPEVREKLKSAALERYGKANASLIVRALITQHLAGGGRTFQTESCPSPLSEAEASDTVRVELRLPRVVLEKLDKLSDERLTPRNHYISAIVLASLGLPQLAGDQIEVLRQSNYELSKIGTNINQIAHAFNILVDGGNGKMPEIGKKLASLRREIKEHTNKVLQVLNAGTATWEIKRGRGQRAAKKRRNES